MKKELFSRDERGCVLFGRFEYIFQILIILSLVSFAIETLPDLSPRSRSALHLFEVFSVTVFTLEYLLRAFFAKPWRAYMFSFFGVVDLVAVLPFYLTTGLDLRSLRAFRLLRLVRLLKLVRYSAAIQRYHKAFTIAKEELVFFGFLSLILLYLSSVGIYYFENEAQP
jgi:voltage-gated potassium channel